MRSNNNNNIQPVATQGLSKEDLDRLVQELEVCAERGENRGNQPSPSICKVSRILREPTQSPFDPQLVSIGLVHREDPKLHEFEWLKECYLNDLLNRCHDSTQKETLDACLKKVNDLIPQIRKSYAAVIENDKLAMMMVIDGCFILEFCLKHEDKENEYFLNKMQNLRIRIAMDLMLLENQVPFFVLQALFDCSMGKLVPFTLSNLLDNCLPPYIKLFRSNLLPEKNSIPSNILDKYLPPYIKRFCSLLPEKIPTTDVEDSDLPEKNSPTDVDHSDLPEKNSPTDVDHSDLPEKNSPTDADLPEKNSTTDADLTHNHVLGYLHRRYQLVVDKSSNPQQAEASKPVDEDLAAKSSNPKHAEASKKPRFLLNAPSPKKLCSSFCIIFRKCTWSNCVTARFLHAEASKHVDEELAPRSSNPISADAEALKPVDEEQGAKSSNPTPADAEASKPVDDEGIENIAFHSIEELDRSGVNFKPHQENEWSMTIKYQPSHFPCLPWFWGKPTLLMPTLVIEDSTELLLMNFIAYEQLFPQDHYYFTSYAYAMDMLIDTKEDIAKLVDSKVLVNRLGSNQEAADMINKICKNVLVKKFCYTEQFKKMDEYYSGYWPKNIAWLRRVYFSNPWSIIALVAAIILFGLTVVQTIYTIRAA